MRPLRILIAASLAAALSLSALAANATVEPFEKRYDDTVYGDFITIGNTVLGCPADSTAQRCADAQQSGSANNNVFAMRRINTASNLTGVYDSSTGTVNIPPGATVAYARLFWGGHNGDYGPNLSKRCELRGAGGGNPPTGTPLTTRPVISVDGAAQSTVTVENGVQEADSEQGPHYYTAEANVTSAFSGVRTGTPVEVAVGNIWAVESLGCSAGWSLTLVYEYDAPNAQYAPERRNVHIWGGHVQQMARNPATNVDVSDFYRSGTGPLRASMTVLEGDPLQRGDKFLVNGRNIAEPSTGATDNFFNSTTNGARNPDTPFNLSVDAKDFTLPASTIPQGATSAKLTFDTDGDAYVASQLALSVPVPDLIIKKRTTPTEIHYGDTVTYTVTATNTSDADYPNAKFSDDLTDVVDDATFDGTATASSGTTSYDEPRLTWRGDVPKGETVTVTYKVKVNDTRTGDGRILNAVIVDGERANCSEGTTAPDCKVASVIRPKPTPTPTPIPTPGPSETPKEPVTRPSKALPQTGTSTGGLAAVVAILLLGIGATVVGVQVSRRSRR